MDFSFTEEQNELREMARAFLAEHSGSAQVRAAMESELGFDEGVWKQIATQLGWTALLVPEEHGGLGLGFVELVALLERTGEALLCAPFLSSACLGTSALRVAASDAQKAELLPRLAEGTARITLAVPGPGGGWNASGVSATFRADGTGFRLAGESRYVPDGHSADWIVVAARSADTSGIGLFLVAGDAPGLTREALPTMDPTRRLARLVFDDVALDGAAALGEPGACGAPLAHILDLGAIGLAAELLGVAQRVLEMAVAYAKERVQFGRPIGSFQAIKHALADMMVAVESTRSAVYYAACVAEGDPVEREMAASLAKARASEAAFQCAAEALQIFGGVGFTWEYDVQLYFKRARAGEALLGEPAWHRERVAARLIEGST